MQLCFATHNQNKVAELRKLVGENVALISLTDLGITTEIQETGSSLKENALIKAQFVYNNYGVDCFADDTGLEVDALDGAPGVYSARFAGEPADSQQNIDKLLALLDGRDNRQARFRTIIALQKQAGQFFFEGVIEGQIIAQRRGMKGFGYDPVFLPNHFDRTFAEMDMREKNLISHRAIAVKKLIKFLNQDS